MTLIQDLQRIARKGPPGPPPRPGLVWHEETSRWRRPEDMSEDDAQQAQEQMPQQQEQPQPQAQPQQPVEPKPLPPPRPLTIEETHAKATKAFEGALDELTNMFPDYQVKGRTKDPHSIKGKLEKYIRRSRHPEPEKYWTPEKLPDLIGFRIETNSMDDVYEAIDGLRQTYEVKSEKDYNKRPMDYYRSFHFLTEINGVGTEIQVRMPGQTKLADWTHDSFYKTDGSLPEEVLEAGKNYARQMSAYYAGESDIQPDCPPDVVRYLGACLN